ncbi:serine/threonine-protein kinase [Marinitenerispora sediminis]|uniref:non-specific serine/threonine protein kinase n=1 Tax=Marinitenerispora sediminis TaxID=1931232 RepID=A0A368T2W4_9ACTN|nr:serine/threonine-protein kinase [Marinitenerispora sediminis]RCV50948.1 serine/threonine protein kinase [Marinitenerispora sediminis]RCV56349.1 serine/threonine protein kinase [Marinitenerispora sediminis]RCV60411.1 serine/threonine protein kinase [Marinitenerispora sediminis]
MSGNGASDTGPTGPGTRAGTLLSGRYRLEEQIGAGGMGEVWRATDTLLNRPVAVKMLHTSQVAEPTSRERFRTEARITAALSHPGIAQVFDYGEQDDHAYLVMELVPGEPLSSILKRNDGLEIGAALDILHQAAQALGAAHARGVVHRDIKPGNLLVTEEGAVKLTDFGIARGNESVTLTQTGMVMGTAQYISPEQAAGQPATPASDIYSLGVLAYECLAGRPPFTADTPLALALAHTREPPPPLPDDVPAPVRALVERLLEKDPADRVSSAGEIAQLAQRLRGALDPADGATTAMNLADVDETMIASAAGYGGTGTAPSSYGTAATQPGRTAPPAAWSPAADATSDRLAGNAAASRRPSRPAIIAAIAAVAVLIVGIVVIGALREGAGDSDDPADRAVPTVSPSRSTGGGEPDDAETELPGDTGVVDPGTPVGGAPDPTPEESPSVPSMDPSPASPGIPSDDEDVPPPGNGDGTGEDPGTGVDEPPGTGDQPDQNTGDESNGIMTTDAH